MAIRVQIPTPMRQLTQGKALVEAAGATVQAVLENLGQQYPGIVQRSSTTARYAASSISMSTMKTSVISMAWPRPSRTVTRWPSFPR